MRLIRVPQVELPGVSALYADYLYHFGNTAKFYRHDPHAPEALRRAARAAGIDDGRRMALAAALRKSNGESGALAELELPDTVAVVTGQQAGLFSGPAYTIYKALTAAYAARRLNEAGVRAVPVFWIATEDHDAAEVDHAWVFDTRMRAVRLEAGLEGEAGRPVGRVEIRRPPAGGLAAALKGFLYADEVVALVEECYRPGLTFGEAFRRLLERLLAGYGLVFLDPLDPDVRRLAAPLLETAWKRRRELAGALIERGRELERAGYHTQVLVEENSSLFFVLEGGMRRRLEVDAAMPDPDRLSPNALLRPVMQDWLLPTAGYVGGPAELAYLAQSEVLYRELLGRMPVALPRAGFTLLDERSRALMDRYDISAGDCFHGAEALKARIAARLIPESLEGTFEDAAGEVRSSLDRLQGALSGFDPTLGAALAKSRAKISYQIEKIHRKTAREALRRNAQVEEAAEHLSRLVYPERRLQERLYSILPFLARHGLHVVDTVFAAIEDSRRDHIVLTL